MTSLISCKVEGPAVRLSWGPCPVSTLCYSSLFPAPVYRAKHLSRYIILGLPKRPFSYFPLLTAYKRLATAGCSARASERARRNMHWRQKLAGHARAHDKFRSATSMSGRAVAELEDTERVRSEAGGHEKSMDREHGSVVKDSKKLPTHTAEFSGDTERGAAEWPKEPLATRDIYTTMVS